VTEPGYAEAGLWARCINSGIGVKRAQRMSWRPRCCAEKETRAHFEQEREPTNLGWHRIDIPATIPLGWKKCHRHSMVDRTSKIPGINSRARANNQYRQVLGLNRLLESDV
jgi:hypothetical protein